MGNRTATLLILVVLVVSFGTVIYWLEDRFGSVAALAALILVFLVVVTLAIYSMFRGMYGAVGNQTRDTMELLVDFGAKDAMTDRYRSQTTLEGARGLLVDNQITLEDLRVQRAQQRQAERAQRLAAQRQIVGPVVDPYADEMQSQLGHRRQVYGQPEESYKEYD